MAATWSIESGNVIRLMLDGTGSGPVSRSRTFTAADGIVADEVHTVYLTIGTTALAVGAFLEVAGGDTTLADMMGGQTIFARGVADGSANLTIRFGAEDSGGGGGGGSGSEALDWLNQAAAIADGWIEAGDGTVLYNTGEAVGPHPTSIKISAGGAVNKTLSAVLNLVPGAKYVFRVWADTMGLGPWWSEVSLIVSSGPNQVSDQINGAEPEQQLQTGQLTVQGSGEVTVSFSAREFFGSAVVWLAGLEWEQVSGGGSAVVDFSNLAFCVGSGTSETPEFPDEPFPEDPCGGPCPPPPVGGVRLFGIWDIEAKGFAFWNSTVKPGWPTWFPNLLADANSGDTSLLITPRQGGGLLLDASGKFSFDKFRAQMDAWKTAPQNTSLEAGIASGRFWGFLFDEPNRNDARYGGVIPFATMVRVFSYVRQLWPTWRTILRLEPVSSWNQGPISAVDYYWLEYHLRKGQPETYVSTNKAKAIEWGKGYWLGIHYKQFEGGLGPSPRYLTSVELREYGRRLITTDNGYAAGMGGWKFENGMWTQSGMPSAVQETRDLLASLDS